MVKIRLTVGDVFIVPTGDGRAGVGQVVGRYHKTSYYFAIFDAVFPVEDAASRATEALAKPVIFLALSFDAKIYVGHWTVVAHTSVDPAILLPAYKIAIDTPGNIQVEDYSGGRRHKATAAEAAFLRYRMTVAPVRLDKALRASLGLEAWSGDYEDLKPNHLITTAAFFD